ncbi:hypothetical protein GCM10017687_35180 [Streptomyces echinatus]
MRMTRSPAWIASRSAMTTPAPVCSLLDSQVPRTEASDCRPPRGEVRLRLPGLNWTALYGWGLQWGRGYKAKATGERPAREAVAPVRATAR